MTQQALYGPHNPHPLSRTGLVWGDDKLVMATIRERAIRIGFAFIDFWAIDFNWQPRKPVDWPDCRSLKTIDCNTSVIIEVEV
jgi:hypothetical protein